MKLCSANWQATHSIVYSIIILPYTVFVCQKMHKCIVHSSLLGGEHKTNVIRDYHILRKFVKKISNIAKEYDLRVKHAVQNA